MTALIEFIGNYCAPQKFSLNRQNFMVPDGLVGFALPTISWAMQKEKIKLCDLCASSEAGDEY